jgi:hypothetical protein
MHRNGPYNRTTYLVQRVQQKKFRLRDSVSGNPCLYDAVEGNLR